MFSRHLRPGRCRRSPTNRQRGTSLPLEVCRLRDVAALGHPLDVQRHRGETKALLKKGLPDGMEFVCPKTAPREDCRSFGPLSTALQVTFGSSLVCAYHIVVFIVKKIGFHRFLVSSKCKNIQEPVGILTEVASHWKYPVLPRLGGRISGFPAVRFLA